MEGVGWFGAIIIGGLAGWIAEKVMGANHGILTNIVLGIIGALVLNAILALVVGGTLGGWIGQLIIGAIGAMLLIWAYRAAVCAMFTSDFGEFRRMQAIADLRHQTRSFPLAAVRRVGAGIGVRSEHVNVQQRLEWYFRGKLPLSNLRSDRPAFGAVLMASALPDEDFESFLAATVLLVLERLTSENGPDDGFWTWRRLAPHYRLAAPTVRAAIMCGFREARRLERIALIEGPVRADCLTTPQDEILAALSADDPLIASVREAVLEDQDPAAVGDLWLAQHRALDTLSDERRRAAHSGFRHLYERPESIAVAAGSDAPVIPVHD
jgi:uncharacterized membrane protein YeaQ/YmgE (transglycosylase-associated protein family)